MATSTDTPEQTEEWVVYQLARARAIADRKREYLTVTPANAVAALRYQEERIAFHLKRLYSSKP